jgi:hypothetical protein
LKTRLPSIRSEEEDFKQKREVRSLPSDSSLLCEELHTRFDAEFLILFDKELTGGCDAVVQKRRRNGIKVQEDIFSLFSELFFGSQDSQEETRDVKIYCRNSLEKRE